MNQPWIYMCSPSRSPLLPPSPSHPSGSSQCTSPEHPSHAFNLGWWSVSPLIVHLFQCCSLWTSHPRLLPQSVKVCSVHLCLFFCFAYRVIELRCTWLPGELQPSTQTIAQVNAEQGTRRGFPGVLEIKNMPANAGDIRGREDPLGKEMATHSSILTWRIPWTEKSGGLQSIGVHRVGDDWSNLTCTHARDKRERDHVGRMSEFPCHGFQKSDLTAMCVSDPFLSLCWWSTGKLALPGAFVAFADLWHLLISTANFKLLNSLTGSLFSWLFNNHLHYESLNGCSYNWIFF